MLLCEGIEFISTPLQNAAGERSACGQTAYVLTARYVNAGRKTRSLNDGRLSRRNLARPYCGNRLSVGSLAGVGEHPPAHSPCIWGRQASFGSESGAHSTLWRTIFAPRSQTLFTIRRGSGHVYCFRQLPITLTAGMGGRHTAHAFRYRSIC